VKTYIEKIEQLKTSHSAEINKVLLESESIKQQFRFNLENTINEHKK